MNIYIQKICYFFILIASYLLLFSGWNGIECDAIPVSSPNEFIEFLTVTHYLPDYGEHKSIEYLVVTDATKRFQSDRGISVTGQFDEETVKEMQKKKCNVKFVTNAQSKNRQPKIWNKKEITWKFIDGNYTVRNIAHYAFNVWNRHMIAYRFVEIDPDNTFDKVDILLSFESQKHALRDTTGFICDIPFDGSIGPAAAHTLGDAGNVVHIHFDKDESWFLDMIDECPNNKLDFFTACVHQIGHALGLEHIVATNATMKEMYTYDGHKDILTELDIVQLEDLYTGHHINDYPFAKDLSQDMYEHTTTKYSNEKEDKIKISQEEMSSVTISPGKFVTWDYQQGGRRILKGLRESIGEETS